MELKHDLCVKVLFWRILIMFLNSTAGLGISPHEAPHSIAHNIIVQ